MNNPIKGKLWSTIYTVDCKFFEKYEHAKIYFDYLYQVEKQKTKKINDAYKILKNIDAFKRRIKYKRILSKTRNRFMLDTDGWVKTVEIQRLTLIKDLRR